MARLARYFLPDQPLHLIQRGNNRSAIFFAPDDYALFRLQKNWGHIRIGVRLGVHPWTETQKLGTVL
jgi:hypothetical protein